MPETLAELAAALGPRAAALARELTKKFEEVRRGSLAELAAHYAAAGPPRGEVVLVIGPPAGQADEVALGEVDAALRDALWPACRRRRLPRASRPRPASAGARFIAARSP